MKKVLSIVAAGIMLALATAPAQAEDAKKTSSSGGSGEVGTMAKSTLWFPVQVVGAGTAWVVGTPIAMVRQSAVRIRSLNEAASDKIGGHEHFPPNLFASVYSVPVGTLIGCSEGVYLGAKNAIAHGTERPFSLSSFSLGDDIEQ